MGFFENIFGGHKEEAVAEPQNGLNENGEIALTPEQKAELDSAVKPESYTTAAPSSEEITPEDMMDVEDVIRDVERAEGIKLTSVNPDYDIEAIKKEAEKLEGVKLEESK